MLFRSSDSTPGESENLMMMDMIRSNVSDDSAFNATAIMAETMDDSSSLFRTNLWNLFLRSALLKNLEYCLTMSTLESVRPISLARHEDLSAVKIGLE